MNQVFKSFLVAWTLILAGSAFAAEPFGMNIHDIDTVPEASSLTAESGVQWVRVMAWWKWMEPTQGQIDWTDLDGRVNSARNEGLEVLITFTSIPSWANGSATNCSFWDGECSGPLNSSTYFADFAGAVANRYKNSVQYYEIWNEPDWKAFWTGSVSQWVNQIAAPGSSAIRAADQDALIVGPATFSNNKFQTYVNASCAYLDTLSNHYYTSTTTAMLGQADNLKSYIQNNCNKPFWVTEFGIDSWTVGEKQQAQDYVDAYAGVLARPFFERLFLFQWSDVNPAYGGKGYGILDREIHDYRRKRSFFEIRDYISGYLGQGGTPLIRDTFAVTTSRTDGSPLNNSQTEIGNRTWAASGTTVVSDNAVRPSSAASSPQRAGISFDPDSFPQNPVATLEIDGDLVGVSSISGGFSGSATGAFASYGRVWVQLRNDGRFRIYHAGSSVLSTSYPASFDPGGLNTIRLQFDSDRGQVSAWLNGQLTLNKASLGGYVPVVSYAGFELVSDGSGAAGRLVDNFQLYVGGDPVAPPTISQHPVDQTVSTGATAQFSVSASGEGTLTYRWQRNGTNLNNGGFYSGVTSDTLTVTNVDSSVAGNYRVVVTNGGGSSTSLSATLTVQAPSSCSPSSTTLCLNNGRFAAQLNLNGTTAGTTPYSDLAGFFYGGNSANQEAAVKVIDGRVVNGKFWVFHGSLTSQPYTLTVTDTMTGSSKTYSKASGSYCGTGDTNAFDNNGSLLRFASLEWETANSGTGSCSPSSTSTCLLGSRFRVRMLKGGVAQPAHPVTDLTSAFSIGNPANPEVAVKVLNGTPVNGYYWVFIGSLTSQSYQVEVIDTSTNTTKIYNSAGSFCGSADTTAF